MTNQPTDRPPDTPRLALLHALNTPPYDTAAGLRGTPLGEAAQLIDAYRGAELLEAAKILEGKFGVTPVTVELRLMSAKAGRIDAVAHSCSNCEGVDPDTCFMNPDRPPEQCSESESDGYGLQCQKPAGHNLCTFQEEQRAADEPRAMTHAKAVQEIRSAARRLYADSGIRVLAALDDGRVCDEPNPESGDRCNRHHGHFGFHRHAMATGVYASWVGDVPGVDESGAEALANPQPPAVGGSEDPGALCVCSHTRGEHVLVGGPFGRGRLLCDSCDGDTIRVCKEFKAL